MVLQEELGLLKSVLSIGPSSPHPKNVRSAQATGVPGPNPLVQPETGRLLSEAEDAAYSSLLLDEDCGGDEDLKRVKYVCQLVYRLLRHIFWDLFANHESVAARLHASHRQH